MRWMDFSATVDIHRRDFSNNGDYSEWLKKKSWENHRNGRITVEDVRETERFLTEWGGMSRVIGRIKKELGGDAFSSCYLKMAKKVSKSFEELGKHKFDEGVLDLNEIREPTIRTYSQMREILKPTCTSKVMHMVCPELFIMWDSKIRDHWGVRENAEGYFSFLTRMHTEYRELVCDFARINSLSSEEARMEMLAELNGCKHCFSTARWIDIYNWTKFSYLTRKRHKT